MGTRVGGQGTNKCEGISIVQVRQRAYTKPGKAGSPPATQKNQGKVSASALFAGNREGIEKYQGSTLLLQKATKGARGQRKQREQALEKTQQINLIALPHFRGLGSLFVASKWDTIYICGAAADGTAPS